MGRIRVARRGIRGRGGGGAWGLCGRALLGDGDNGCVRGVPCGHGDTSGVCEWWGYVWGYEGSGDEGYVEVGWVEGVRVGVRGEWGWGVRGSGMGGGGRCGGTRGVGMGGTWKWDGWRGYVWGYEGGWGWGSTCGGLRVVSGGYLGVREGWGYLRGGVTRGW